jgi:hypothetical protein
MFGKPNDADIVSLWGYKSEVITLVPARLANVLNMMPIGP